MVLQKFLFDYNCYCHKKLLIKFHSHASVGLFGHPNITPPLSLTLSLSQSLSHKVTDLGMWHMMNYIMVHIDNFAFFIGLIIVTQVTVCEIGLLFVTCINLLNCKLIDLEQFLPTESTEPILTKFDKLYLQKTNFSLPNTLKFHL